MSSSSSVRALNGDASVLLNPDIPSEIKLEAQRAQKDSVVVVSDSFYEVDSTAPGQIRGYFDGNTALNKSQNGSMVSGKIDLNSAERYSLHSQQFREGCEYSHENIVDTSNIRDSNRDNYPLLSAYASNIRLETLSWMDAIRRKFEC